MAERDRAGLVEQDGAHRAEPLDRAAALDHDPGPRGAREARHERDRRGEDERARRRDDEDRERPDRVARGRPGDVGDEQRRGQEERGVAVGHADERRPLALGLLDEPHERRVGALGRRPRSARSSKAAPALAVPLRTCPPR